MIDAGIDRARFRFLLFAGDTALILGQRLTQVIGHAPVLEEELGTANIALDLLGHARMWLSYAGEVEGRGRTEDDLAFYRTADQFHNALLVEQPNGNFADVVVRQWLFDTWHQLALDAWSMSNDEKIAAIAQKAKREVVYHRKRSADWVLRLGDGTEESHSKAQRALDTLLPYAADFFAIVEDDDVLATLAIAAPADARPAWLSTISTEAQRATLTLPSDEWKPSGGRNGKHSEHLSYLLAEMQSVRRSIAGDRW